MESNPHRFGLPTDNPRRHHRKEEAVLTCTQEKPQEQSLSDYAQQDLSEVTQKITARLAKALNKTNNS
jgi:hypothetical protein